MRVLKQLAVLVFWFFLWTAIPAALLYPLALWMAKHTQTSGHALAQGYVAAIGLLFLPTGFSLTSCIGISSATGKPANRRMLSKAQTDYPRFAYIDCRAIPDCTPHFKF